MPGERSLARRHCSPAWTLHTPYVDSIWSWRLLGALRPRVQVHSEGLNACRQASKPSLSCVHELEWTDLGPRSGHPANRSGRAPLGLGPTVAIRPRRGPVRNRSTMTRPRCPVVGRQHRGPCVMAVSYSSSPGGSRVLCQGLAYHGIPEPQIRNRYIRWRTDPLVAERRHDMLAATFATHEAALNWSSDVDVGEPPPMGAS
ncbi:hypothetical protein BDY21DRAFT_172186 [Lineolata rhizophorae]|uniref:Uncharacterized protein n=1 Tax=Lineolata rhizophorae TaxID=578093 RepID=A0A6A6NL51_9PEZI|nr:hypothetical protein BDY21DRAFT_172186 [Lineolata rhizophorae]